MAWLTAIYTFCTAFLINIVLAGILYYSSILVEQGELSVGDISTVMLYLVQIVMKFGEFSWVIGEAGKVKGSLIKIIEMMQLIPEVNCNGGKIIP